jgi:hypothetical protein
MDVDRAAARIVRHRPQSHRVDEPDSTAWIDEWTGASKGLLYCAECGANVLLKIPVQAAAPTNPDRLPAPFYRCAGCPRTKASAKLVIGLVQDVVVRRWDNPAWLEQWCSAEIRIADDEIVEDKALLAWFAAAPHKNTRALVRATRDTFGLDVRRSVIEATLRRIERRMPELEGRRAALEDLRRDRRSAAEQMARGKIVKGAGWRAGVVRPRGNWWEPAPTQAVWEVTMLAQKWAESPSSQVTKRWSLVRSILGDDRLRLTTDQQIHLVTN